jgi:nitrilase
MKDRARVAVAQVEPVVFDRAATIEKLADVAANAAAEDAQLVLFPETFVPVYPSSRWVRALVGGGDGKPLFARLARESITVPSPETDRIGAIAREHGIYLAVGANELEGGTIYNALLVFGPDGSLALHHRKLMPTNHERLVWGLGDGRGLETIPTAIGAVGGLICWENFMPLARAALYEAGVEIYLAPTADDSESWLESMRHVAREARAFVLSCCVYQRASSYPADVPVGEGDDLLGRGGSAIIGPNGEYLAGPLWDEEGLLFADLDPDVLYAERQRFDPAGHYSRPDVLKLRIEPVTHGRAGKAL